MIVVYILAGLFGSLIGSFLNVVIYRLPRGMPLGMERSKCPACGNQIAWYDNVPVFSWLLLGARCRACKVRISARYPAVELLTAVLFVLCLDRTLALRWTPLALGFLVSASFASVLVALAYIDFDLRILPRSLSVVALGIIGVVGAVAVPDLHGTALFGRALADGMKPGLASLLVGLVGAGLGLGLVAVVRLVGSRMEGPGAEPESADSQMGWAGGWTGGWTGAKAMGCVGLLLGPEATLLAFGLGAIVGSLGGGLRWVIRRQKGAMAWGGYFAGAAMAALLYRDALLSMLRFS
ncbi:MAG: prepilin peptidase [Planctomycetota bacterium]